MGLYLTDAIRTHRTTEFLKLFFILLQQSVIIYDFKFSVIKNLFHLFIVV